MKCSSINQNTIINIEVSGAFKIKTASFLGDSFTDIMDMVMYCNHSMEPFLCSRRGDTVVIINVYGAQIKDIKTSI